MANNNNGNGNGNDQGNNQRQQIVLNEVSKVDYDLITPMFPKDAIKIVTNTGVEKYYTLENYNGNDDPLSLEILYGSHGVRYFGNTFIFTSKLPLALKGKYHIYWKIEVKFLN